MAGPLVTDHALVRFLERAGGIDVEGLRASLSQSLSRVHEAVEQTGGGNYLVSTDTLSFVVRKGHLTTILPSLDVGGRARALKDDGR